MQNKTKILIIDDDKAFRVVTQSLLEDEGFSVETVADADSGLNSVKEKTYDLILSDLMMEGKTGIQFLQEIKQWNPQIPVIMVTGYGSIQTAVEAMKLGAEDYLTKPSGNDELILKINRVLEKKQNLEELERLRTEVTERYEFSKIIGKSRAMQEVFSLIELVADTDSTVIIRGETGTGKELVAKAIHYNSPRREKPFVTVNCAALPDNLLESELFGHEKGAFTGAIRQKQGRFEKANGGTLFLDELGDIPPAAQVKLLRVLQERTFERVGGDETIHTDIRLISATNKNLEQEIRESNFREDLYFRINVMPVTLPPLRDRKEDIPLLVSHFSQHFNKRSAKKDFFASELAMNRLIHYHWPGNVRELQNVIERAVILSKGTTIEVEHLHFTDQQEVLQLLQSSKGQNLSEQAVAELYARLILNKFDGNKKATCAALGINFKTLQKRLGEQ
ncbi:MAG: sigma-54-dependent Fis family transcriptional regulator [Calditrichaeota bacterium]|nr:MAG: sigma-54-dependent Fis family transcriptional regulator [Calditrichota bacterium]